MAFPSIDGVDYLICTSHGNDFESKQAKIGVERSDDLEVEVLDDLDTMMEDIDNRLRIARMVSDSMIKGMVSAVEQEADEKIKAKESELASLKRSLQFYNLNGDQSESWGSQGTHEHETFEVKGYATFDKLKESSLILRKSATDQFKKLRKQIKGLRDSKIKRNGSSYEMVGLGGILEEEQEKDVGLEKTIDNLEMTTTYLSKLVDTVLLFSECQQDHDLKRELEDMVMQSSIKCIQEELREESLNRKTSCSGSQSIALTKKFSNISDLRNELEALKKLLPSNESGNLVSYTSLDADNTHGNPLKSQLSLRSENNGKSDESKLDVPDPHNISHMNKEELILFFNNLILCMKREHESKVQEMTDKYMSLKGKYLSERGSVSVPNKDFETLRRKIPEVVSKLDNLLSESDEFLERGDSIASIDNLNALIRENRQLKNALAFKNDEAFIMEDVYKCVIRELNQQIQDSKEESELEIVALQDIYDVLLKVGSVDAKNTSEFAIENKFIESLFMQEVLEIVFKETSNDVEQKFENLHKDYITVKNKAIEMDVEVILEIEERERLKNEVHSLRIEMEEKDKLALDELNKLRKQISCQETSISKKNKEMDEMSEKLSKAQMEINSINEKLSMEEIKASNAYKNMVLDFCKEKQSFISLIEAKEKEHRKQMEAVVVFIDELSTKFVAFECRVTRDIVNDNTRLENSRRELTSLIKAANVIKRTGLLYKQKLERKCSDLQIAEEEVDLLGDEVDTLFGLLEKIHIALDHYSPVLQHYTGVIEILELVRRELSGESLKVH